MDANTATTECTAVKGADLRWVDNGLTHGFAACDRIWVVRNAEGRYLARVHGGPLAWGTKKVAAIIAQYPPLPDDGVHVWIEAAAA